jgi:putative transcriptional regulator
MNLVGNLVIAPPAVKGNFWYKTVIMVTEHHSDGSTGLVLNKRSQMSIVEFGEQLGFQINLPGFVYLGGPVNVKSLSLLHTNDWVSKNTMRINDTFSLSSADDILPRFAMGDTPAQWRMFLGMCGWADGQLLGEIRGESPWRPETSWCLATPDEDLVFGLDTKDQWNAAIDRSGLQFAQKILA